jgi:signal transduction histidine kinase
MTEVPLGRNQEVTVQLTASLAGVDEAVRDLRRLLLLVGAAAIGGAAAGGWLLGSVAIRPLQRLRGEAERVAETADLSRRVPTAQGPREVDELAASLNTMLDRLEGSAAETEAALTASRQFAANVAHELRTPLTSIRTNLEVLASHPTLPVAERATILGEVQAQHARLLEALDALRLLARGELAADDLFVATDVAELLDEVVAQAAGRHPEATITLEARADPLEVRAWPEGLRVLVDNLVRNAVTHGRPSDGTADGTPPEVRVELDADEREWWIAVSDRGPGVPPAERARIFERFTRGSEAAAQGSGLGLALVAQQVELLGGQVTIEDAPGGGARFVARMPRR